MTACTALADLVHVDLGWWKVAGYDLMQVVSPRTALGTAWIVWRGDHVLHTTDTLPRAADWVADQRHGQEPAVSVGRRCKACEIDLTYETAAGWVDALSGDDGGTYDFCPDSPTREHHPGRQGER